MESVFVEGLIVMIITYLLIALRGVGRIGMQPWAAMLLGASLMLALGVVEPGEAVRAVNLDVILFLFSLFSITSALEVSGFFSYVAGRLVSSGDPRMIMLKVFLSSAALSLALSNDGVAGGLTPIIVALANLGLNIKPLLYAIAFGVTIGSVALPIGNPQNLLIALESGMPKPFIVFTLNLLPPTLINLALTYPLLLLLFKRELSVPTIVRTNHDPPMDTWLSRLALITLAVLIPLYFISDLYLISPYLTPVTLTLIGASVIYAASSRRREILYNVEWSTIVFFIGLFIVSYGALKSGVLGLIANYLPQPTTLWGIFIAGLLLSQVISNVPLVAIYLPVMMSMGVRSTDYSAWLALAASSTIAGNLTLLGAASNVIISEASERRGQGGFGFLEFMKYGLPVTALNAAIYYLWLSHFQYP